MSCRRAGRDWPCKAEDKEANLGSTLSSPYVSDQAPISPQLDLSLAKPCRRNLCFTSMTRPASQLSLDLLAIPAARLQGSQLRRRTASSSSSHTFPSGIHALPSSQFTPSDHSLIPNYFPGQPAGKQANVCATFSAFNDHDRTSLLSPTTMHFPASLPPGPVACIRRLVRLESGLALTLHFCLAPVALAPRTSRLYDQVHSQTSDATVGCRALPRMYRHPTVAVSNVPQEMKGSFYTVIPVVSC